jgi:hypothetical protein
MAQGASTDYANLAGDYYSDDVDATYHVVYRDGRLSYSGHHVPTQVLVPAGPDTFRAGTLMVRFERGAPGSERHRVHHWCRPGAELQVSAALGADRRGAARRSHWLWPGRFGVPRAIHRRHAGVAVVGDCDA